jgi:hypothetical protein
MYILWPLPGCDKFELMGNAARVGTYWANCKTKNVCAMSLEALKLGACSRIPEFHHAQGIA